MESFCWTGDSKVSMCLLECVNLRDSWAIFWQAVRTIGSGLSLEFVFHTLTICCAHNSTDHSGGFRWGVVQHAEVGRNVLIPTQRSRVFVDSTLTLVSALFTKRFVDVFVSVFYVWQHFFIMRYLNYYDLFFSFLRHQYASSLSDESFSGSPGCVLTLAHSDILFEFFAKRGGGETPEKQTFVFSHTACSENVWSSLHVGKQLYCVCPCLLPHRIWNCTSFINSCWIHYMYIDMSLKE